MPIYRHVTAGRGCWEHQCGADESGPMHAWKISRQFGTCLEAQVSNWVRTVCL